MVNVTVSPEFNVQLPRDIREALAIQPGDRFQILLYENRIELIPVRPMREVRGFVRGIDTALEREESLERRAYDAAKASGEEAIPSNRQ